MEKQLRPVFFSSKGRLRSEDEFAAFFFLLSRTPSRVVHLFTARKAVMVAEWQPPAV